MRSFCAGNTFQDSAENGGIWSFLSVLDEEHRLMLKRLEFRCYPTMRLIAGWNSSGGWRFDTCPNHANNQVVTFVRDLKRHGLEVQDSTVFVKVRRANDSRVEWTNSLCGFCEPKWCGFCRCLVIENKLT